MATFTYTDTFSLAGVGINGATVNAYKASRFSGVPALNASAPAGSPDATTTTATTAGSNGALVVALPTSEAYWISVTNAGTVYWKGPVYGVFSDGSGALGGSAGAGTVAPSVIVGGATISVDPGGTGASGLAAKFAAGASLSSLAYPVYDHLANLIFGVGPTGGPKVFGDRSQAGTGVNGPFIAFDGTTNPPSILLPSAVYGVGGRMWAAQSTPAAGWVAGATQVNDLWRNTVTGIEYVCTVAGALATTIAAGSNGGNITTIASWAHPSAGALAVASSASFPAAGDTVAVATSGGTAYVTYTGTSTGLLTGCTLAAGTGTVSTGGRVQSTAFGTSAGTWSSAVGVGAQVASNTVTANYTNTTATGSTLAPANHTSGSVPTITLPTDGRLYRLEFTAAYCISSTNGDEAFLAVFDTTNSLVLGSAVTILNATANGQVVIVAPNVTGSGQVVELYTCSTTTSRTITIGAGSSGAIGPSTLAAYRVT